MAKEYKAQKDGKDFVVREERSGEGRQRADGSSLAKTLYVVYEGGARVTHSDSLEGLLKAGYKIEVDQPTDAAGAAAVDAATASAPAEEAAAPKAEEAAPAA